MEYIWITQLWCMMCDMQMMPTPLANHNRQGPQGTDDRCHCLIINVNSEKWAAAARPSFSSRHLCLSPHQHNIIAIVLSCPCRGNNMVLMTLSWASISMASGVILQALEEGQGFFFIYIIIFRPLTKRQKVLLFYFSGSFSYVCLDWNAKHSERRLTEKVDDLCSFDCFSYMLWCW